MIRHHDSMQRPAGLGRPGLLKAGAIALQQQTPGLLAVSDSHAHSQDCRHHLCLTVPGPIILT